MSEVAALKKRVCSEIRSHLIYNVAKGLQLSILNKNYKEETGIDIPYRELGFSSLLSFLQTIPDVVQIRSGHYEPQIYLVSDEKTKHIEMLAALTNSKRPIKGRYSQPYENRLLNSTNPALIRCVPPNVRLKIGELLKEVGANGISIKNLQSHYQNKTGMSIDYEHFGFATLEQCLTSIPNIVTLKVDRRNNIVCFSTEQTNPRENDLKCVAGNNQNERVITPINALLNEPVFTQTIKQQYVEDSLIEEESVSDQLKTKIRKVLKIHPNGLRIDTFLDEYEKINNEVLNLEDIGYYDITELVERNSNIFKIFYPTDSKESEIIYDAHSKTPDFCHYVQNKTKEIPKEVIYNIVSILENYPHSLSLQEFEGIYEFNYKNELPWRDFGTKEDFYQNLSKNIELILTTKHGERHLKLNFQGLTIPSPSDRQYILSPMPKKYVPEDAATCADKYTQQTIPTHKDLDDYIQIVVSDVQSPGCFFIQLLGLQYTDALELLMNKLEEFYQNDSTLEKYQISHQEFKVHLPCAALYCNDWHRAIIIGLLPLHDIVEVFYVDYGTTGKVLRTNVYLIPKMFMELPSQAIKSRLGLVEPSNLSGWTSTASTRFFNLTKDRDLQCKFLHTYGFDYKKGLEVVITDTNEEEDVQINDIMIQEGHAQKCEEQFRCVQKALPDLSNASSVIEDSGHMAKKTLMIPESASVEKVLQISDKSKAATGDLFQALFKAKCRKEERTHTPIDNFDCGTFSKISSKPCPNLQLPPNCNATTDAINSPQYKTTRNIYQPGCTVAQVPERAHKTTPPSTDSDTPVTSTKVFPISSLNFLQASKVNQFTASKGEVSQKRFTKFSTFSPLYTGHLINYKEKPYLTSFDLSHFIFASTGLIQKICRRLKIKLNSIVIEEKDCPDLFAELNKVQSRGFQFSQEKNLTLYPLLSCIEASRIYSNKELEKAMQQCLDTFDPEDIYWQENKDDYGNLNLDLLQRQIDYLTSERKVIISALQNSNPENLEHHIAYTDIMNKLIYAINMQKIQLEEKSQADAANGTSKTSPDPGTIDSPIQTKNVQPVAPIVSTQTSLQTNPSNAPQVIPALTNNVREKGRTTSAVSQTTLMATANNTHGLVNSLPGTNQPQGWMNSLAGTNPPQGWVNSLASTNPPQGWMNTLPRGPPPMTPIVPNIGYAGPPYNNVVYPFNLNFMGTPCPPWFFPQQLRPFSNLSFPVNHMNNTNSKK